MEGESKWNSFDADQIFFYSISGLMLCQILKRYPSFPHDYRKKKFQNVQKTSLKIEAYY